MVYRLAVLVALLTASLLLILVDPGTLRFQSNYLLLTVCRKDENK